MKFGICTKFVKENGNYTVPHMDFIKSCGFEYFELPLNALAALSDEEYEVFLKDSKDFCLPIMAFNVFFPANIRLNGEDYDEEIFLNYVKKAVKRAHEAGAKKLVLGSGGARNVAPGYPAGKAWDEVLNCIKLIAQEMEKYEMMLQIEHLNLAESNIITSFEESSRLSKNLKLKNVKSILDYYHFALGNEDLSLVEKRGQYIGHVHFARPLGRVYPDILDMPDFSEFFAALKDSGYKDSFSMECAFLDMEKEPIQYKDVLDEFKRRL